MARSERQGDGTRSGVGTLTRSGTRPRPQQAPEPGQAPETGRPAPGRTTPDPRRPVPEAGGPAPEPRRGRGPRPVPPQRPAGDRPPADRSFADRRPADPQAAGVPRPEAGARLAGRRDNRVPSQRVGGPRPADEPQRVTVARRPSAPGSGEAPHAVAAPPRPGPRRRVGVPPQAAPAERQSGPQRLRAPGPQPAAAPSAPGRVPTLPGRVPPAEGQQPVPAGSHLSSTHRMPFVLLLCGLLGGALVSALVISTTLAEGSFQISKLQDSTSALAKQRQTLQNDVAQAQSPQRIAEQATRLGMRRTSELQYLDLKSGTVTNTGPVWSGAQNAPGYAP